MKYIKTIKFRLFIGLFVLTTSLGICFNKMLNYLNELIVHISQYDNISKNICNIDEIKLILIFSLILFIAIGTIIVILISNSVIVPLLKLTTQMEDLNKGLLPEITEKSLYGDEIDSMRESLKLLINGIRKTADFAVKIGKGEFDTVYTPLSKDDLLGHTLLAMRTDLINAAKRDDDRNNIIACDAEVSSILRSHSQLVQMGDDLLRFLVKKTNAIQGAFYVVYEETDGEKSIHLLNTFAYNKKKFIKKVFKFGEGLVGQSAIEMDYIHRTEIPRDYVSITSGLLGEQRPKSIFIMPLITNNKIYGLLEFASINNFSKLEIDIIKNVSEIIAQTIFNLLVNERTTNLLTEAQRMSAELSEKSIALQQNAEEMQATQEELKQSNVKLEEQIKEVNNSQKRTFILLENSSEVINIIDKSGTVSYVSPSVKNILGYEVDEIIGTKEINRIIGDGSDAYIEMFKTLLVKPKSVVTTIYSYYKKNGDIIWLEVSGRNMLVDVSIKGVVLNIRDITERRRAEVEARMRSQMQSLSENSPDLITRLNTNGKIYYINPAIEALTNKKPADFTKKTIFESELNEAVVRSWDEIIQNVLKNKQKNTN